LRQFFHTVGATGTGGDATVSDDLFAFVQGNPVMGPVDAVSNAVRQISCSGQCEPNDSRVIVIEAGIVRRNDGIVFGHPLQFLHILHTARHNRVRVDRAIIGRLDFGQNLVQREAVSAKIRLLEGWWSETLGVK
jgi:hypothetical protein